jgi:hypothetical protein
MILYFYIIPLIFLPILLYIFKEDFDVRVLLQVLLVSIIPILNMCMLIVTIYEVLKQYIIVICDFIKIQKNFKNF